MTTTNHLEHVERSRAKLLRAIGSAADLTLFQPPGNIGDRLIHAGTKQLLSHLSYCEKKLSQARSCTGHTALLGGCGGWCGPFHGLPAFLPLLEERFRKVIVLPSSFDTTINSVKQALSNTCATVFAREEISFQQIRNLCRAEIAHDCAFYFDYSPFRRSGQGILTAFRTDEESAFRTVPPENKDLSAVCGSLDEWLHTISSHELIRTDRAHVTIAGALLGKRVEYLASSYHKVPAIVDYCLRGFPVSRLSDDWFTTVIDDGSQLTDAERLRILAEKITSLIPADSDFLLVDNNQIGAIPLVGQVRVPFLEHEGTYWGSPANDKTAISELERMRRAGAGFIVFAWPALWWLDHYAGFHRHLRSNFRCLFENDSLVIFDVRSCDTP